MTDYDNISITLPVWKWTEEISFYGSMSPCHQPSCICGIFFESLQKDYCVGQQSEGSSLLSSAQL